MGKISRARKKELLKQYYDGDTVGRAAVYRYLDMQKATRNPKLSPAISADELLLLRDNLTPQDNDIYMGYAALTETFSSFAKSIWSWDQACNHSFYRILAIIGPLGEILRTAHNHKDFIFYEEVQDAFYTRLKTLEEEIPMIWELSKYSIIFLHRYDFIMHFLGNYTDFDINFLCADLTQVECDFNILRNCILVLRQLTSENKINEIIIPKKVINILEKMSEVSIDDLKPNEEVKSSLVELFNFIPNTFPSAINSDFLERLIRTELLESL